jgi:hypothetical protein
MLKLPSLPVVTVEVSIGVEAPAVVVVFTEYNWMVAPETGCCPPYTEPMMYGTVVVVVLVEGAFILLSEHPARRTEKKENKEAERTLRLDTVDTSSEIRTCRARFTNSLISASLVRAMVFGPVQLTEESKNTAPS